MIAGVGGLGCTASMLLAAAGIGTLMLYDHDTVSISNLNRQLLYTEDDLGKMKAITASKKLRKINPECDSIPFVSPLSDESVEALPLPDIIVDCLDNLEGRIALTAYASRYDVPLVHAAVQGFSGQLTTFIPQRSACPLCALSGETSKNNAPIPSLGTCVSAMASIQATEAIKLITETGTPAAGKMLFFNLLTNEYEALNLEIDPACIACSDHQGRAR